MAMIYTEKKLNTSRMSGTKKEISNISSKDQTNTQLALVVS